MNMLNGYKTYISIASGFVVAVVKIIKVYKPDLPIPDAVIDGAAYVVACAIAFFLNGGIKKVQAKIK